MSSDRDSVLSGARDYTAHDKIRRNLPSTVGRSDVEHEGDSGHAGVWVRRVGPWRIGYATFAFAASLFSLLRMRWAWPDAAWQTTLSDIEAIDRVLNHGLGGQMGIGVGGEHALTGYRWFQYFNARFFGLNSQVELFAYFALTLTLALAIGFRAHSELDRHAVRWPVRLVTFTIPVFLASLVGAGSRGMEIGQFTGMTLFVLLALLIETRISTRLFTAVTVCAVPVATLLILGSYAGAPAIALAIVSALQFVRPTLERARRAKLFVLAGTFLCSLAGWIALMAFVGPPDINNRFSELLGQVASDPAFIPKYFLGGAAGSVISAQTLEVTGFGAHFAYAVGALVVSFAAMCVGLTWRRGWTGSTVPLLLVLMPACLAVTLVVGRGKSALWLLSPWYGFHLHLFLVGCVWLLARSLATGTSAAPRVARGLSVVHSATALLLVGVVAVTAGANAYQWRRESAERLYFQNVQMALLFPGRLTVSDNGLTQLILPLKESLRAVDLLRKNRLSVYRDPQAVWRQIGDGTPYDEEAAGKRSEVTLAGMLDSHWAGSDVRILIGNTACQTLHVDVMPYSAIDRAAQAMGSFGKLTVTPSFGAPSEIAVGTSAISLDLHPTSANDVVELSFSRTWNPAALGLGPDKRDLAAVVSAGCG